MSIRRRIRQSRAHRDERGYMLVELLTAATLTVLLVGLFGTLVFVTSRNQSDTAERSAQIQEGRVMVERMTREIREGYDVSGATASQVSFITFVRSSSCGGSTTTLSEGQPAIACRVTYACASGTCTRQEANPDGSGAGSAVRLVSGLASSSVFSYEPLTGTPQHVSVTLVYPDGAGNSDESVTISDGAEFRNQ